MNLRKKRRSAEVSLDECSEMEECSIRREMTDNRATPRRAVHSKSCAVFWPEGSSSSARVTGSLFIFGV